MTHRFLVTGATGYLGRHVLAGAREHGTALGVARGAGADRTVDVADGGQLHRLMDDAAPTAIIHLAGRSAGDAADVWDGNVRPVSALLEVAARPGIRVVVVGSAAEYGDPGNAHPVAEEHPARPVSAYGRAKLAGTARAVRARQAGMDVVVARVFNVVGPGMDPRHPFADFAAQIARLPAAGGTVDVGNAELIRDFISVGFAAQALVAMAAQPGAHAVVNVCSGRPVRYAEAVHALLDLRRAAAEVRSFGRPAIPAVVGDPTLLRAQYGLVATAGVDDLARLALSDDHTA